MRLCVSRLYRRGCFFFFDDSSIKGGGYDDDDLIRNEFRVIARCKYGIVGGFYCILVWWMRNSRVGCRCPVFSLEVKLSIIIYEGSVFVF